jgi:hypothetical protein
MYVGRGTGEIALSSSCWTARADAPGVVPDVATLVEIAIAALTSTTPSASNTLEIKLIRYMLFLIWNQFTAAATAATIRIAYQPQTCGTYR